MAVLTLKLVPYPDPADKCSGYWDINYIVIYDTAHKSQEQIKTEIVHEFTHQLGWELFGIYPKNLYDHDSRLFTGKGKYYID